MKYKSIIVTKRGGPEVLEVIENDLRPPLPSEARVKILATHVCQDDAAVRIGNRPFLAKIPFVPGYSILGVVDAVGEGVTNVTFFFVILFRLSLFLICKKVKTILQNTAF